MNDLIDKFQKFGFNKVESMVYYTLIKNPKINGSQIAKILNIPRTSVYIALNSLYQQGVIFLLPGESNEYKALNPNTLFDKLKNDLVDNIDYLKNEFSKFELEKEEEHFWNISGYENIINKIKEILNNTEKEVYMNTNFALSDFRQEIINLNKKNVRIILFSFEFQDTKDMNIEFYFSNKMVLKTSVYKRIMLVSDKKKSLIASGRIGDKFLGTFSDNELLASIISEHIHHDIYIYKLEQKYKMDLVQEDILINSIHEKDFEEKPKI